MGESTFESGDKYNRLVLSTLINIAHSLPPNEQDRKELFTSMAWAHLHAFVPSITSLIGTLEKTEASTGCERRTFHYQCKCQICTSSLLLPSTQDYKVDIFILTVKEVELAATLAAFGVGIETESRPPCLTNSHYSLPLWIASIEDVRIGIGLCSTDGLSESAVTISNYARFVSFDFACLVGMAGGSTKTNLGDVVVATLLHDYDRRIEEGEIPFSQTDGVEVVNRIPERRFVPVTTVTRHLRHNSFPRTLLARKANSLLPKLRKVQWLSDKFKIVTSSEDDYQPALEKWDVHIKPILCGGALVEKEAAFNAIQRYYDNEAVAVDMESYGFAYWCHKNMPENSWIVLRGISDHCNREATGFLNDSNKTEDANSEEKEVKINKTVCHEPERRKDWQFYSTFRAAYVLRYLIENDQFGPKFSSHD